MKVRHKIPSVFSLSMVDVLCCALGCVILLWLMGAKQSEEQMLAEQEEGRKRLASASEEGGQRLATAEDANAELRARVNALLLDRDRAVVLESRLAERIRELERSRQTLASELTGQQARAKDLDARLRASVARVGTLEADVKDRIARLESEKGRAGALGKQLTESESKLKATRADLDDELDRAALARTRLSSLEREVDSRRRELAALTRSLADAESARKKLEGTLTLRDREVGGLTKTLSDSESERKKLASKVTGRDRALTEAEAARKKLEGTLTLRDKELAAAEEREKFLQKQLRDRGAAVADATKALDSLKQQTTLLRSERDSRFAGIALTGKRVIFLIDCSGSMELLDANTQAPHKWAEVGKTVARLMRSLPALEKYQIICFSTKATFPLGRAGKWLDYSPTGSPDESLKALGDIKPTGGTNLYAALDSAFDYRGDGLDAIYLLSDGLPNQGEGVTAEQRKKLSEIERGQLLGRVIRRKLKDDWNRPVRSERVKINTIGFFYESPDLGAFLWALARENDGSFVGMSRP